MSTEAIVMMIVAMLVLWGGLALAIINLVARSAPDRQDLTGPPHRDS